MFFELSDVTLTDQLLWTGRSLSKVFEKHDATFCPISMCEAAHTGRSGKWGLGFVYRFK